MTQSTVARKRLRNTEEKGADALFTVGELEQSRLQGFAKDLRLYDCGIKTDMSKFLILLLLLPEPPGGAGLAWVCLISSLCYSLPCYWLPFPTAQKGEILNRKLLGPPWGKSH